ncbi:MAG: hypothetical protein ACRDMZ_16560, partial [Solirubrobacteraceae bacterium]
DAQVSVAESTAPPADAAGDSWTVPAGQHGYEQPAAVAYEPVADEEPAVEGEAIELPVEYVAPVAAYEPPVPLTIQPPAVVPDAMPFAVAEQPVVAMTSDSAPAQVSALGDAGDAYASGHAAAPGPSWQEPVMVLAGERPELVVGAAFAGGVLAAMILRRLGN